MSALAADDARQWGLLLQSCTLRPTSYHPTLQERMSQSEQGAEMEVARLSGEIHHLRAAQDMVRGHPPRSDMEPSTLGR